MKTKALILLIAILIVSVPLISTASACSPTNNYYSPQVCSWPELPNSAVTLRITSGAYDVPISITLSNVPSGYDITNATYTGWCIGLLVSIRNEIDYSATVNASSIQNKTMNQINYILNHKQGTSQDVQAAMWLILGFNADQIKTYGNIVVTSTALTMYRNALRYGGCFSPGSGEIVALICFVKGYQTTIIEVEKDCYYTWQRQYHCWTWVHKNQQGGHGCH
jgi:hypothetical protein